MKEKRMPFIETPCIVKRRYNAKIDRAN